MTIHHIPRKNGQGVWCYAEKGSSQHKKYPTLVFLHGIGINKDSWSPIIRKIPSFYHSIVVDMPGDIIK
jgi:pimeloyl-ACP methyl ester carboxylesterase